MALDRDEINTAEMFCYVSKKDMEVAIENDICRE